MKGGAALLGFGLMIAYLGYAILYWGVEAIQGKPQDSFASYLLPFLAA